MKKIFVVLLILIVVSLTAFARPVKRITFPKRATKVTVTGYLNGYKDAQIYLIRLRKGQKLTIDANRYVSLFITDPNGEDASDMDASCHSHQAVENTIAGDYKIKAVECMKADAWKGSFKLSVKVVNNNVSRIKKSTDELSNNSPMAKSIDIAEFNGKIEKAKKEFEVNSENAEAKKMLANAYFDRAFALTNAAQYRAALGDFRKGLKLNPNDKEAKEMHDQIIGIFQALGREPPKEGEEPLPLPFKKP